MALQQPSVLAAQEEEKEGNPPFSPSSCFPLLCFVSYPLLPDHVMPELVIFEGVGKSIMR